MWLSSALSQFQVLFNRYIFELGITSKDLPETKRHYRLLNITTFFVTLLSTHYYPVFYLFGIRDDIYSVIFISLTGYLFCFLLTYLRYSKVSLLLLLFISSLELIYYSCVFKDVGSAQYILFGMSITPFMILNTNDKYYLWPSALIPVFSFIILELYDYSLFSSITITHFQSVIFGVSGALTTFTVLIVSSYSYKKLIESSEKQLLKSHLNLQKAFKELKVTKAVQQEMSDQVAYAQLVNGIAHEIKNPLAMIRTRSEIIESKPNVSEEVKKFSKIIQSNIDRLTSLIRTMLTYGSAGVENKPSSFYLYTLLQELKDLVSSECRSKGIQFRIHYTKSAIVFCDRKQLFQSLLNIVVNAITYTPEGGTISISSKAIKYTDPAYKLRKGHCISIVDTGIGIKKNRLKKVFNPYYTTKANPYNTGLGLSTAFMNITENNGQLSVESVEGQGTSFFIYLPSSETP